MDNLENLNEVSEEIKLHLKKAKTWNKVLLVLKSIGVVFGVIGIPGLLNPNKATYDQMGDAGIELYKQITSIGYKATIIATLLISIALLVMYFRANKNLKNEETAPKYPYYIAIIYTVFNIIYGLFTGSNSSSIPNVEGMENAILFMQIFSIVTPIILTIPAVLVLVHLFKADVEE